jgi:hypothetical protein
MPITMRAKYSGGPNRSANPARVGARTTRPTTLKVPAMKDPKAEIPRAGPARPFRAILYPSRHVTTEDTSPGMFSRMDVVEPPYVAP